MSQKVRAFAEGDQRHQLEGADAALQAVPSSVEHRQTSASCTRCYRALTRRLHPEHRSQHADATLIWQIRSPVQYAGDGSGQ